MKCSTSYWPWQAVLFSKGLFYTHLYTDTHLFPSYHVTHDPTFFNSTHFFLKHRSYTERKTLHLNYAFSRNEKNLFLTRDLCLWLCSIKLKSRPINISLIKQWCICTGGLSDHLFSLHTSDIPLPSFTLQLIVARVDFHLLSYTSLQSILDHTKMFMCCSGM